MAVLGGWAVSYERGTPAVGVVAGSEEASGMDRSRVSLLGCTFVARFELWD